MRTIKLQKRHGGQIIAPRCLTSPAIVYHVLLPPLLVSALLILSGVRDPVSAQSIADRVAAVEDGQVRFSYAAREGVCGNGRNISTHSRTEDWEGPCESGPVRVALDIVDNTITDIDTYVGGRWRERAGSVDLGTVSGVEASDYLLSLAETSSDDVAERAIFPATIADSVEVWPRLLRLAKDSNRPRAVRQAAVLWVGMMASEVAVGELEAMVKEDGGDHEVKEVALMALSQLPDDRGVAALLDVARTSDDPEMRKHAIFWLGQTDDPRALSLFEEILTAKR
jgi:hypothetical protein